MYLTGLKVIGNVFNWFESYLTNISQMVLFNGKISDIRDVTCGVPQGSILGPLLFILYINDFAKVSDKLFHVLFADDTNVFLNGKNMNMLIDTTIQQELSRLYVWLLANKLSLNLSKTHFMVFHRARHKQYNIHIEINKVPIEQVKHTTFLGVIFDDRLEWSNHITYIHTKIAKGVGIICRAKKYFNTSALINLYNAFVFPYLIYCVEIWGNALSIHIQSLVKLQNKIVRIITSSYHTTEQLYNNTGILPFKILVTHRIGLLMYKLSHGNVPKPIQNLYKSNNNVHTHFTRHAHHFHKMRGNNELSIELLHFKVYSSGINFFRISTSMYHIHVLSIY